MVQELTVAHDMVLQFIVILDMVQNFTDKWQDDSNSWNPNRAGGHEVLMMWKGFDDIEDMWHDNSATGIMAPSNDMAVVIPFN